MNREPIEWVEIDVDQCTHTYGDGNYAPEGSFDHSRTQGGNTGTNLFDTSASITAVIDLNFAATPSGIIWECGNGANVLYLGVTSGRLVFRVGDSGAAVTDDMAYVSTAVADFAAQDARVIATYTAPNSVKLTVLINGIPVRVSKSKSVNDLSVWASAGGGSVGGLTGSSATGEDLTDWNSTIAIAYFYQTNVAVGSCSAFLSKATPNKCFNGFKTCQDKDNYSLGSITYKYSKPQSKLPSKTGVFPVLESVSSSSGMVNIAGADDKLNSLGKRETLTFRMTDFPYHDRYTDKYASERVSGVAQLSGIGYDPATRGTHFGKLRARWPYYAGRAARHCYGFIDGGILTDVVERHYIISDMTFNTSGNYAEFEAKDILHLADNDKALAPIASSGELLFGISETDTEFTLAPENVGEQYPASGRAVIGNEIVDYTRDGDTVTLVNRGAARTSISSHGAGDTFQTVFTKDKARVDDVIYDLFVNYAAVDPAFCPTAKWEAEITRWASSMRLSVDITKPTGVNKLIGELAILGLSIWWDSELQEIGLKVNRPPDEDTIFEISDTRNIMENGISIDDRDDDRLTQIGFYSVIIDPTSGATDGNNHARIRQIVDNDAQSKNEFGDTKVKQIYTRWLGDGNESLIRILGKRLINRFRWSPARYTFKIKYDQDIKLTDVVRVNSRIHQDETGLNQDKLMQVVKLTIDKPKFQATVQAQTYQFDQRYGFITENTRGSYLASTDAQRARGLYFCDNDTLRMSNGDPAYQFI